MELGAFVVSLLGGGLSGGCLNILNNWRIRQRDLRTKLYPQLNNISAAYAIRLSAPGGQYWASTVGLEPAADDKEFVDLRVSLIFDLIQFNELKEARLLRKALIENSFTGNNPVGTPFRVDLKPEWTAISDCFSKLHKKLKLH